MTPLSGYTDLPIDHQRQILIHIALIRQSCTCIADRAGVSFEQVIDHYLPHCMEEIAKFSPEQIAKSMADLDTACELKQLGSTDSGSVLFTTSEVTPP